VGAATHGREVSFGRVITNYAYFAYVADVIVLPDLRGAGIGTKMIQALLDHPDLATVGSWTLRTSNAHKLSARFGFETQTDGTYMRLVRQPHSLPE
jgi:GNAT superfamily N-acetyltransferase